jgi:hypothetical protein
MATEIVTLKQICTELKLDPREARERLRTAVKDTKTYPDLAKTHKPRMPWQWAKRSAAEKQVRALFAK